MLLFRKVIGRYALESGIFMNNVHLDSEGGDLDRDFSQIAVSLLESVD